MALPSASRMDLADIIVVFEVWCFKVLLCLGLFVPKGPQIQSRKAKKGPQVENWALALRNSGSSKEWSVSGIPSVEGSN